MVINFFLIITTNAQNWVQKSNFPGTERYAATGFTINGKLYFGTGYNGLTFFNDWWEYDPATDTWTQKTSFPGQGRLNPNSFVINNKGYIIFGSTTTGIYTFPTDFWEYDPLTDQWTQKANFPGPGRYTAIAMEISGKGYAGTGWKQFNSPFLSDWWEYNPVTNNWSQKANFGGGIRRSAMGFSLLGKGYLGLGEDQNNVLKDFWEYDPLTDSWLEKSNFIGSARMAGANFTLGNYGFFGTGVNGVVGDVIFTDYYKYDPVTDVWSYINGFYPGRVVPVAVGIANCAFILSGRTEQIPLPSPQNTLNDFWEYCLLTDINEISAIKNINIYPNPWYNNLNVNVSFKGVKSCTFELFNSLGQMVATDFKNNLIENYNYNFDIEGKTLSSGIYYLNIQTENSSQSFKLVKY